MKKFLRCLPIFLSLFSFDWAIAQDSVGAKVKWEFSASNNGNDYKLILKGTVEPGWGLFSVTMPDDLPNTRIEADSSTGVIKSIKEIGKRVDEKNAALEAEIKYFKDVIEIEVNAGSINKMGEIRGTITYMAFK